MYFAVVAGASRGLGFQFVKSLSEKPDTVVIGLYRSPESASQLLELAKTQNNVHAVKSDIAEFKSLKEAANEVSKITGGKLDLLINNGAYNPGDKTRVPLSVWSEKEVEFEAYASESFRVNALGPIHATQAFLPLLRKGTTKKIVTLNTGAADAENFMKTGITMPAYAMSKAASWVAMTSFATELKDEGFTVLSISPGVVNTFDAPPPSEVIEAIGKVFKAFQTAYPEWSGVPYTPEESVRLCLDVIDKSTPADSGNFVSQFGTKQWL